MEQRPGQWQGESKGYWREQKWECCGGYLGFHWRTRTGMRSWERCWGWHALLTKFERPDWDSTVVCREERTKLHERYMTAEVNGRRSRERQKNWWRDMIQQDMNYLRLKQNMLVTKEVKRKDPSGWPLHWDGLIQAGRRCVQISGSEVSRQRSDRTNEKASNQELTRLPLNWLRNVIWIAYNIVRHIKTKLIYSWCSRSVSAPFQILERSVDFEQSEICSGEKYL